MATVPDGALLDPSIRVSFEIGGSTFDQSFDTTGEAFPFALALEDVCAADIDGDGELTLFDFLAFQNLFDAGDPAADFDGDGSLTLFDFLSFQNEFDGGCP